MHSLFDKKRDILKEELQILDTVKALGEYFTKKRYSICYNRLLLLLLLLLLLFVCKSHSLLASCMHWLLLI